MKRSLFVVALLALVVGCSDSNDGNDSTDDGLADAGADVVEPTEVQVSYDFENGKRQQWRAAVTDYPSGAGSTVNFVNNIRDLPEEIEGGGKGYYLEAHNEVRDIFMFMRRQIGPDEGLKPATTYRLDFDITFASNYPKDCSEEIGQKMYLKMGGSKWEPASRPNSDRTYYELNVKKGDDEVGGDAASTAGDLTHDEECALIYDQYALKSRSHNHRQLIETTDDGTMWLLVGVDAVYEGEVSLYIDEISVTLTPEGE